jgi:hypothetical protein
MRRFGGVFAVLLVIGSALVSVGNARADGGDEPQYAEFYTPPDPLPPGQPGDLIRTEPSRLVLEPFGQLRVNPASSNPKRLSDFNGNGEARGFGSKPVSTTCSSKPYRGAQIRGATR